MARVFQDCTEEEIVQYAYGEHLLRRTTPIEEVRRTTGDLFPAYKAARELGKDFNPELLEVPEPKVALHRLLNMGSEVEETQEVAEGLLPVPHVYILEGCVLLYTVEMSAVDGYCASTGARKTPLLSDTLLLSIRSKLYCPPLKRTHSTSLSSFSSPLQPQPAPAPLPAAVPKTREPLREVEATETGPREDWRPYHYASDTLKKERNDCSCRLC